MSSMQVVTERPIEWSRNPDPSTFIGDSNRCPSNIWKPPCSFTNYSVSADGWVSPTAVAAEISGVYTQLCARMQVVRVRVRVKVRVRASVSIRVRVTDPGGRNGMAFDAGG